MGEYLNIGGKQVAKLGVMDDFRYVRHDEGEYLAAFETDGDGHTLRHSLGDPATLWRFPFPHEDGHRISPHSVVSRIGQRDMFTMPTIAAPLSLVQSFDHRDKVVHMKAPGGGYGVNVWVPCPYSAEGRKLKASPVPGAVSVMGERYDSRGARTVFACIYCERMWSMDSEDLARVIAENPKLETLTERFKACRLADEAASKS